MLLQKFYFSFIVTAIVLFYCNCTTPLKPMQTKENSMAFQESRLMATPWKLIEYQQNNQLHQIDSSLEVTITFEHPKDEPTTTRLYGRAACNRYFGGCSIDANGKLTISSNMGMTRMMCAPPEMNIEDVYIALLPKMSQINFVENSKTKKINMVISNDKNEKLIFGAYNLE